MHAKLINRAAVGPGSLLFLGLLPLAAFNSFVPLYVDDVGLGADAIFALYGVLILVVRIFGARIPDRFGGRFTGAAALACNAAGMAIIVTWQTAAGLILGTVVFSAGMSLLYPAFFLLALHGVPESERASAVGTISVFFDLSQGLGAVIVGGVAALTGRAGRVRGRRLLRDPRPRRDARDPRAARERRAGAGLNARAVPSLLVTNDFPPKVGGIQSYLYELWRRLPAADTTVLTTPYEGAAAWDAEQSFRVERTREGWLLPTPSLVRRVEELAREVDADVVFLDPMVPLGLVGPRLTGAPYVVVTHGAEVTVPGRLPGLRQLSASVLRHATGLVAAGEYSAREAARAAGRPLPTLVIPPGVDPDRFRPLSDDARRATRLRHGLDPDAPLVLGVSRLVPRKGFDVVLDAVAGLPGVHVAIAGAGRDRGRLDRPRRAAGRTGPTSSVGSPTPSSRLCTRRPTSSRCCAATGGAVSRPRASASCSSRPAPAACPSVAGRSGGSHEAVVDGETGVVVDPRDVRAARDAIGALLADDAPAPPPRRCGPSPRRGRPLLRHAGRAARPVGRGRLRRAHPRRRTPLTSVGEPRGADGTLDPVVAEPGPSTESGRSDAGRAYPGRAIVRASWASNVIFAVTAIPVAAGVDALDGVAVGVALALFAVSLGVWVYAFAIAVARSAQGDDVVVANLFLMQGPAPRNVRWHLFGSFAVCLVITAATAVGDPFGVLVPMLPLGFVGLWGARHGTFPARKAANRR